MKNSTHSGKLEKDTEKMAANKWEVSVLLMI